MAANEAILHCCVCKQLLTEPPLLLSCFHDCCKKCAESITDSENTSLTCPVCTHPTMVANARLSYFVAAQVRAFKMASGHLECELCASKNVACPPEAEEWCNICWKTLCEECTTRHSFDSDHPTVAIERDLRSSRQCLRAPSLCQLHQEVRKFVCTTCETTKCSTCLQSCLEGEHAVDIDKGSKATAFVTTIKQLVCDQQSALREKLVALDQLKFLSEDIESARSSILSQLKLSKRALADAVEKSYEKAVASLDEACSVALKELNLDLDPEQLAQRTGRLLHYSEKLLEEADVISLLDEQQCLLAAMQSLSEELTVVKAPVKASQCLRVDGEVPDNVEEIFTRWIGLPLMISDIQADGDGGSLDAAAGGITMDSSISESSGIGSSLDLESKTLANSSNPNQGMLSFDTASSSFRVTASCYDMATTRDCNLLLALGEQGLHECDLSGTSLTIWKPSNKRYNGDDDSVVAVDTLEDGRAVVGLRHIWWLVLLRRKQDGSGCSWQADKYITLLTAHPKHLSAQSDLLAVAEWPSTLVLVSFNGSPDVVLRCTLDYYISAVALAEQFVITASSAPVAIGERKEQHVVDAYTHRGERLWRQACDDLVQDIAVTSLNWVLYLALFKSKKVTAVKKKDGSNVADVLGNASHMTMRPLRIALKKTEGLVLAVLFDDGKSISVFHSALSRIKTSSSFSDKLSVT